MLGVPVGKLNDLGALPVMGFSRTSPIWSLRRSYCVPAKLAFLMTLAQRTVSDFT